MVFAVEITKNDRPVGYRYLVDRFEIKAFHFRWSFISPSWQKRVVSLEDITLFFYPSSFYKWEEDPFFHLEFALKHEGLNLLVLKQVFRYLKPEEVSTYVHKKKTGKYQRIIWYLYEKLLEKRLDISDVKTRNYIPLLDSKLYYVTKGEKSVRHYIIDNLLGTIDSFCPVVRKTEFLIAFEKKELEKMTHDLAEKYDPHIISRALQYLYTKETLSSWEIEHEKPGKTRLIRFTSLLRKIDRIKQLTEEKIIALQKEVVEKRFALDGYRDFQNYVGEEPGLDQLILHYIAPKPEDVSLLMGGLLHCFEKMIQSDGHAVIAATILSFGFVYIHPFWDGNGRLHRFLIHYALNRYQFTPQEIIFPISAVMLKEQREYDQALESFSRPLLECITDFEINKTGEMKVHQETIDYYRFIDFTFLAEYLFRVVERTITTEFEKELAFLTKYDQIKQELLEIVEMPDQKVDLFIHFVRQNDGRLSERKREKYFTMLSNQEIGEMEKVVKSLL